MNKTFYYILTLIAAAVILAGSCAREYEESADSVQARILKAYIEKYYPDATLLESGNYLIDSIPGTGDKPADTSYVLVSYSITYLNGTYIGTSYDSVSKQLGTYSESGYYSPVIWYMPECSSGLQEILYKMREGGQLKAILTSKQLEEENNGYYITSGDGSSKIYDISLVKVIGDIDQYQYEEMKAFASKYYPAVKEFSDTTEYGFFFHKTVTFPEDTLKDSEFMDVSYVGRYMDFRVFDTNIADTAKRYRIYSGSDDSYSFVSFQHNTEEADAIEGNDYVKGFSMALNRMNYGEKAIVIFYHELGYGSSGSGNIPGYIPLCFELQVEPNDEEE